MPAADPVTLLEVLLGVGLGAVCCGVIIGAVDLVLYLERRRIVAKQLAESHRRARDGR